MNKLNQLVKRWRLEASLLRRSNSLLYRLPHRSISATESTTKEAELLTKCANELEKAMKQ